MVADVHRTFLYGGIFLYPADKKSPNGKLRYAMLNHYLISWVAYAIFLHCLWFNWRNDCKNFLWLVQCSLRSLPNVILDGASRRTGFHRQGKGNLPKTVFKFCPIVFFLCWLKEQALGVPLHYHKVSNKTNLYYINKCKTHFRN